MLEAVGIVSVDSNTVQPTTQTRSPARRPCQHALRLARGEHTRGLGPLRPAGLVPGPHPHLFRRPPFSTVVWRMVFFKVGVLTGHTRARAHAKFRRVNATTARTNNQLPSGEEAWWVMRWRPAPCTCRPAAGRRPWKPTPRPGRPPPCARR
jgi:hypothetical protein